MKHHSKSNVQFVVEPQKFNKYSKKEFLQYCLGATMYMPGTKKFLSKILTSRWPELTSMVMCFEDSIAENQIDEAEENVLDFLKQLSDLIESNKFDANLVPLIVIRVRNYQQFVSFSERLTKSQVKLLTAFNFPKFSSENASLYLTQLRRLNDKFGEIIYGMPILESEDIAFVETRIGELMKIKVQLNIHKELILNVRVGGTDFSSYFGVRRGIDYTIYDIITVRDCLADIINILGRADGYILSGPVWEYFSVSENMKIEDNLPERLQKSFFTRTPFIDDAVDGLIREIILDKANGFIGKTVIHPSHVKYVNSLFTITREEYEDALQITENDGGVVKSSNSNKMNEINPHMNWARKTILKARAYGVVESEKDYFKLFWS
ncbi:hypothetical protein KQ51_00730 [Candidatus Izimaplasma bacterium HR1]|jgi:citrate lyase beta subunit|uniref:HpcH/HpaI aldolase/citrate lyase family protein n=1 Tax=Candidatus Izimoplasma sp. HR1 TaxID=1541959 RepID=UPI0004F84257|nr:hypothetical protein KQ51_00730 [Candidatus Izimaplasma bacterium HR1]